VRLRRYSRLKMYMATTLLAFIITALIGIIVVSAHQDEYFDIIITYIEKETGIGISVSSIKLKFPFIVRVNDLKLYSKENDNPFVAISESSFIVSPIRIFAKIDMFYLISDIVVDDAFLYPYYFDKSIFKSNNDEAKNVDDRKTEANNFLKVFINKNLTINNFRISLSESGGETSKPVEAIFTLFEIDGNADKYVINSSVSLPDNTSLTLTMNSKHNLNNLYLNLRAYDDNGSLFDYEANTKLDNENFIFTIENKIKQEETGEFIYNIENDNASFSITNIYIGKSNLNKIYNMMNASTLLENFLNPKDKELENTLDYLFDSFIEISLSLDGSYKKDKTLSLNFNINTKDENFNIEANGSIINKILYINDAMVKTKIGSIFGKGYIPLNEPIASEFNITTDELLIFNETLNLNVDIKPSFVSENTVVSKITLNALKYKENLKEKFTYSLSYNKNNKVLNINLLTDSESGSLDASIYMNNKSENIISANGTIPQSLFIALVGYGIVDPLSDIEIDYTLSRDKNGKGDNTHNVILLTKKVYTEDHEFYLNASINKNNILIRDFAYAGINAYGEIDYDNNFDFDLLANIDTPIGKYFISGAMKKNADGNRTFYASADDEQIVAQGNIKANGEYDFVLSTTKDIEFNGTYFGTKIELDNTTKPDNEVYLNGVITAKRNTFPIFVVNAGFELSNETIAFTNIIYDYGVNTLSGSGNLYVEDTTLKFDTILNNRYIDGVLAVTLELNANNMYATIVGKEIPVYLDKADGMYGNASTKITVIGDIKDPVMYLDEVKIKDFEVLGYIADVSLTGYYRKNEMELKNILVNVKGANGIFYPASERPSIKIPKAYFSEDLHSAKIEIKNLNYLSIYNGNIDYNMRVLGNGDTEYRLKTSKIGINKRRIQEFSTIIVDSSENISFVNKSSHGISGFINKSGNILFSDLKYIYDNKNLLNITGTITKGEKDVVDMLVTSETLNLEIFEIFSDIFSSIEAEKSKPSKFTVDRKQYTLYTKLGGTTDNITITGRFVGNASKIKTPFFSDVFTTANVDFLFEEGGASVTKLEFFTKKGKSLILTGDAELTRNFVNYINFDVATSDESQGLLNANADLEVIKAKGPTYVELNIGGDLSNVLMTGKAVLKNANIEITVKSESRYVPKTFSKASQIYWYFDVEAMQRVNVSHNLVGDVSLADNSKIRIYNSIKNGMEIEGTVDINRGNIYYLQNIYTVERGYITFPTDNSIDPIINATAYTHTKYYSYSSLSSIDPDIGSYDVTLYMEINARISQLLFDVTGGIAPIKFYTIPALGQYQVNQLAGVIQNSSFEDIGSQIYAETTASSIASLEADNDKIQQIVMSYGDLVLRNTVLRPIERWVRQFLGIDYINLNPAVIGNLIDIDNDLTTASVFNNTSVSIGKYVSKNLFIKYDVTYKFNDLERQNSLVGTKDPYYFEQQFGFEVSLLNHLKIANIVFEYKINPFKVDSINGIGQEFNLITRWRF